MNAGATGYRHVALGSSHQPIVNMLRSVHTLSTAHNTNGLHQNTDSKGQINCHVSAQKESVEWDVYAHPYFSSKPLTKVAHARRVHIGQWL